MSSDGAIDLIYEQRLREELTMADALAAARVALRGYSEGNIRIVASVLDLDRGDVHVKGAYAIGEEQFVVKIASWVPPEDVGKAVHGGGSLICDAATGHPVALLLDEHYLSSLRTAAASAVAADALARTNSVVLGIVGTGAQGQLQVEALAEVRPLRQVLIHGRRREAAEALVELLQDKLAAEVCVADSVLEVMGMADIVVTATASRRPFISASSLRPGQHLSAIGADGAGKAELALDCFSRARVFVDSVAQSAPTAEIGAAIEAGLYARDQIAGEIGGVLAGQIEGRRDEEEITIAKMTGIGALDLAIAQAAMKRCQGGEAPS